jgi:hypothetical protein
VPDGEELQGRADEGVRVERRVEQPGPDDPAEQRNARQVQRLLGGHRPLPLRQRARGARGEPRGHDKCRDEHQPVGVERHGT